MVEAFSVAKNTGRGSGLGYVAFSVWDMLRMRLLGDNSVELFMPEGSEFRKQSVLRGVDGLMAVEAKV